MFGGGRKRRKVIEGSLDLSWIQGVGTWKQSLETSKEAGKISSAKYTGTMRSNWGKLLKDTSLGKEYLVLDESGCSVFLQHCRLLASLLVPKETRTGAVVAENRDGTDGKTGWDLSPFMYYTN